MLRLTGGEFKGRTLLAPRHDATRPTQAKLRQALFNSLQAVIPGARVLDLFAGSGALGLEALSRGAAFATFVESARAVAKLIERNVEVLGVGERSAVVNEAVDAFWKRPSRPGLPEAYDVILADPPYAGGWELRLLEELPWGSLLAPDGVFCLEWGVQKTRAGNLPDEFGAGAAGARGAIVKVREKNYGDSVLTTYTRKDLGA